MVKYLRFQPSGKKIIASRGKSLLQIGLSGGLKLQHHCANGNCGECRARLISGRTSRVKVADYCLSEQEKAANTLLMCCHEPDWTSGDPEIVLEALEQGQDKTIDLQNMLITVTRIEEAGDDYRIVSCKTPRSQALQFYAGQQVALETRDGQRLRLAVANCPCEGRFLEFHVAKTSGCGHAGEVFPNLKKGDKLALRGPYGEAVFRDECDRPIIFVAYESGFSAINSLIEQAQALEFEAPQTLFRFSAGGGPYYRANLCHAWEDALDNFTYVECQEPVDTKERMVTACAS
ncbi:MAG: 2Fe-2S iron-sulfur cluster binding domain-containing protein, partial [Gammaproteobacteria bacterium]|nr:2Fe-2S iron-sulfur cluster binding domain-containing protein [Gammaproteobacteria bacterium]